MPPRKKDSPFKEKDICVMAAGAIFVETSLSTANLWQQEYPNDDFWSNSILEKHIDHKGEDFDKDRTGRYDKLLTGIVSESDVLSDISTKLKTNAVYKWRNLPLWGLLSGNTDKREYIHCALQMIEGDIRQYIWEDYPSNNSTSILSRREISPDSIKKIAKFKSFDALLTLTALAIEANERWVLETQYLCAYHLRKIFAHVVCNTPHLFIRWPLLMENYRNMVWSQPFARPADPKWFNPDLDVLELEIMKQEKISRNNDVQLPPIQLIHKPHKKDLSSFELLFKSKNKTRKVT